MKKIAFTIAVSFGLLLWVPILAFAGRGMLHQGSWDFYFGNHIDWHQESKLTGGGVLKGRLFIMPVAGKFTEEGEQVYRHPRGPSENEECGVSTFDCEIGWVFSAYPRQATFLYHSGVNGNDHPVWLLNRNDIPQPSAGSHFHWIANQGPAGTTDDRMVYEECDKNNAGLLENQAPAAVGKTCNGWIIELRAVRDFAFEHGGEVVKIRPGIDVATHINIVSNYKSVTEVIPPSR